MPRSALTADEAKGENLHVCTGSPTRPLNCTARRSRGAFGSVRYAPIRVPQAFHGGLLLASERLPNLQQRLGFHEAWEYQRVVELIFDGGHLTQARDRSPDAAARREAEGIPVPHRPWWQRRRWDVSRRVRRNLRRTRVRCQHRGPTQGGRRRLGGSWFDGGVHRDGQRAQRPGDSDGWSNPGGAGRGGGQGGGSAIGPV
jgi:hypothetical protein